MKKGSSKYASFAERYEAALDRIEARLDRTGGCWLWPGACNQKGYGRFTFDTGGTPKNQAVAVHRVMYERHAGPIPEGMTLDHLCRMRNCANPEHLEPVTQGDNVRRGKALITSCPRGHEYTDENTYMQDGKRSCLTCRRS